MKKLRLIPTSLILLLTASVVFPVGYLIFAALSRPEGLRQMLLTEPFTLYRFWKSLALCVIVVFLHGVISCTGGFAFAKLRFRWRRGQVPALHCHAENEMLSQIDKHISFYSVNIAVTRKE